ncbi:MAG: NADP-dependent oxidoreductase [Xenococcaceae cyanobacterium MO_188.B29]|nr:NADP-dependent oxidoreductase [Xenococcaceae cyanobacterium MO_188.B29]
MNIMKAVRIHNYGGLDTLVYEDAPRPQPGEGQVLIHVRAAGVNPIDWKIRQGFLKDIFPYEMPLILGTDVAGVVEAVGAGVTNVQPGQDIYGVVDMTLSGAYAEYALGLNSAIAPKPQSLNYEEAASVPIVAMTAYQALLEVGGLTAGQSVLIHGAAGGVGSFAVQFAKNKGIKAIGTASAANLDFVRNLGAEQVIDYKATQFEEVVSGVDMVLDLIGGDTQERSWDILKPGGILVSTASPPNSETASSKGVRGEMMMVQPKATNLEEITAMFDRGELKTFVDRVLPLSEAQQAHELSQGGHVRGKLVLQVA